MAFLNVISSICQFCHFLASDFLVLAALLDFRLRQSLIELSRLSCLFALLFVAPGSETNSSCTSHFISFRTLSCQMFELLRSKGVVRSLSLRRRAQTSAYLAVLSFRRRYGTGQVYPIGSRLCLGKTLGSI
jgi:hypothetical protein